MPKISTMGPQEHILNKLEILKPAEKSAGNFESSKNLADFIFRTIMSGKFRKFSVTADYQEHVKAAIQQSITENAPIKFVFPFGAYKLWRLSETPETDWAELFTLMYYATWLKPITEVYGPGIWFDFSADDIIVERMNNIPKNETEIYAKNFNELINFLNIYLPHNIKFTLTPVSSFYAPDEFEADLHDRIEEKKKEFHGLPILDDRKRRMVELNVRLKPKQDEDPLWREKIELLHQAYYAVSKRRPYTRARDKILVFVTKGDGYIAVGTTKTSVAKFWVGIGALKKEGESYKEYVLSPSQLGNAQFVWEDISIPGLKGKNFSKIRVMG